MPALPPLSTVAISSRQFIVRAIEAGACQAFPGMLLGISRAGFAASRRVIDETIDAFRVMRGSYDRRRAGYLIAELRRVLCLGDAEQERRIVHAMRGVDSGLLTQAKAFAFASPSQFADRHAFRMLRMIVALHHSAPAVRRWIDDNLGEWRWTCLWLHDHVSTLPVYAVSRHTGVNVGDDRSAKVHTLETMLRIQKATVADIELEAELCSVAVADDDGVDGGGGGDDDDDAGVGYGVV